MIKTLRKQIKWRKDRKGLFICNCKKLIDMRLSFEHEGFLKKLFCGVDFEGLSKKERQIFLEFEKMNFLTYLELRVLSSKDFSLGMDILGNEIGSKRVRDPDFLRKKFNEFPEFFIGIYLEEQLVGIVCGFPREDYLLVSEIAVDCRFQRRGFGRRLTREFEKVGFEKYNKINVGALDDSIEFYKALDYNPFLLVQFEKGVYCVEDFSDLNILNFDDGRVELKIEICNLGELNLLRNSYPDANLQYIFSKSK